MTMAPGEGGEEIPAGDPIPTLTLHDHGYASGVWSFTLETDLQLTMDTAPYEPMRGHVHVYVDGTETAMIARKQFTVPHLSPGRHIVRVALAATDHRTLLHDGAPIADEAAVVVPSP